SVFALSSPVSGNSTSTPSSASVVGTPSRLARTTPPVPAFTAPEARDSPHEHARDGARSPPAGMEDDTDTAPAAMEDVGGKKQHHHQHQHQRRYQHQQHHHQPGRQQQHQQQHQHQQHHQQHHQQPRTPNHPSSDLFLSSGARRREVELRLHSPLSTPGRRR
ncbi:unnamed protein product, partial [Laminaria digitata]